MKTLLVITSFLCLVSCSTTTIEEDMDEYCECEAKYGSSSNKECLELIRTIIYKYEYDPGSEEYITHRLENCPKLFI